MSDSIKSVDVPSVHGLVVLNPDGTALGAPVGGATSANQTNGSQKTQIVDAGGEAVTVTAGKLDVNASVDTTGLATSAKQDDIITAIGAIPGGGGTQYTEDVASAANPVGTSLTLIREDARAGSLTTTDGDNVSARGNNKGELYVKTTDSDALLTTIDADTGNISTKIDTLAGAVSGTEMQVDVLTLIPGTGATSLGKAISTAVGATDTGVGSLAKIETTDTMVSGESNGEWSPLRLNEMGELKTDIETQVILDGMDATTGWSVLGNDTTNLATTTKHITGTLGLTFDKANGADNTTFAGIQKTITSTDLSHYNSHGVIATTFYLSSVADAAYVFIRLGTDSTNYNEWRVQDSSLVVGEFNNVAIAVGSTNYVGLTGNGWNNSAVTYIAVGVAFDLETNTLTGIVFDRLDVSSSNHSTAQLTAQVTSSVSTPNVNVSQVGGSSINTSAGNALNGTQRVTLANNDVLVSDFEDVFGTSSLVTATQADDIVNTTDGLNSTSMGYVFDGTTWDRQRGNSTDGTLVNLGTNNDVTVTGTVAVTQSGTWDEVGINDSGNSITVDYATTGSGTATGALRVELPTNGTGVIATVGAVTAITNALPAGTNAIGKLSANSGVDIGDVDVTSAVITGGAVAHDGADSGNPIKVGGRAVSAEITAIANNDRSDFVTDLVGKQIVMPYANPENFVSGAITSAMTGTTSTSLVAAPAAGLRNYINTIVVSNSHATVGTDVIIQDGSGGTTLMTIPAAALYGGAVINLPTPLRQPTTATAIYCANVTTGASTKVSAVGYKGV